jgi:hypothetical protein
LANPKDEAPARQEKEDDYHPSGVQEVFRHRFMGYVLSVTGLTVTGLTVTGLTACHRVNRGGWIRTRRRWNFVNRWPVPWFPPRVDSMLVITVTVTFRLEDVKKSIFKFAASSALKKSL